MALTTATGSDGAPNEPTANWGDEMAPIRSGFGVFPDSSSGGGVHHNEAPQPRDVG